MSVGDHAPVVEGLLAESALACLICSSRPRALSAARSAAAVKVQSFATFRIRTENGNDIQTIYGEPKDR
ncbi:hypothetical protein BKG76_05145 [Mycobacteroides franklinii]|uniref:Uncharacterized protein n=1 Tax=Mycobacteroides franklinii TaxID=948102 RepID=A0A1S1LIJ7_9MYCO|nr:hypothetical protein [Mycobacteroides franklinii]OHU31075.1 hypothetical protein BKG76_05145 [Mycobacteroides franklinii]